MILNLQIQYNVHLIYSQLGENCLFHIRQSYQVTKSQ